MENNTNESFRYTYSAKRQEEIRNIRRKYIAEDEDKMEQLRRLDQSVSKKATSASLATGIAGILILGFGMSLALSNLSGIFGMQQDMGMVFGIIISLLGLVPVCCAYPLYNRIVKKEREKIAPVIIQLTDELMK